MVRKLVLSLVAVLAVSFMALAQNKQVSGTVTDSHGVPVVGATVMVDGTNQGTTTGADGKFAVSAPANGSLTVSFIGFAEQTVAIAGKTTFEVVLSEDTTNIEDVVVVAFGTTTKEAFTGSATVIKGEELTKRQTGNVIDALTGVVPGLQTKGSSGQPGSDSGFTAIRGFSSMNAERNPLIIVDGAPYSGNMSNINSADIASITVLKDAASAALYGARGAAGVILITTKKGTTRDAQINFDMKIGVNQRAVQPYDVITDPGQYYEAYYNQTYNYYYYNQHLSHENANVKANELMLENLAYNVYSVPNGELLVGQDGKLNPNATLGNYIVHDGQEYLITPDDWDEELYRSSIRQEYNLSLSGGTDRMNYFMSLGYLDDKGIVEKSDYTRVSARLKADYQANKWLKVGANFAYVNGEQNQNNGGAISFAASMAPIYPMYQRNAEGKIMTDKYGYLAYDYGNGGNAGLMRPIYRNANPLGEAMLNNYNMKANEFNTYGFAEITFMEGLKLNIDGNYFFKNFDTKSHLNGLYGTPASQQGSLTRALQNNKSYNLRQTLSYTRQFGDKHHLQAMIGHEYYNAKTVYLEGSAHLMFSSAIQELNAAMIVDDNGSYLTEYNTEGYLGQVNYDYDQKYYVSASFRRDASSYFHPDHRWGNFWSIGGAWLINKEQFMKNAEWIDMLKLKASYGEQGNDAIGNFMYTARYSLALAGNTIATSFVGLGNKTITWETTGNFNVGAEFSLWNGRLSGSLDYYNKKTSDLLFWVSIPESAGSRGMYSNVGDVRNYGFELDLAGTIIKTKNFQWDATFNLSHNKNEVLSLSEDKKDGWNEAYYYYEPGGSMYTFYCQSYAGVDEYGQAMFWADNEDGTRSKVYDYNEADEYKQGDTLPDVFGGFGTTFRLYGFDLGVMFNYQIGGKVYDSQYASLMGNSTRWQDSGVALHKDVFQSWTPQNTSSNIPRSMYGDKYTNAITNRWLTDASYLSLQSINLGYTLPQKWVKKIGLGSMRIYAAAENIWFWSKREGFDPRHSFGGLQTTDRHSTSMPSGVAYAPIRTISGGLQVSF